MLRLDVAATPLAGGALLAPDHIDPNVAWVIPAALTVAMTASGPAFTLLRQESAYGSGGSLALTLRAALPDTGAVAGGRQIRVAPLRSFAARLRLRGGAGGGATTAFPWRDARVASAGEVVLGASFSTSEMDLLRPLLDLTPAPIDVEAVFSYAGLFAGLPLIATVRAGELFDRLRGALPAGPIPESAFRATGVSLLALDATLFKTTATDDRPAPDPSSVMTEIMARLAPMLTTTSPPSSPEGSPTLALVSDRPGDNMDLDLAPPRTEVRRGTATWSVGDFLAGLTPDQRARALPSMTNVDVLSRLPVQIVTSAAFDPRFLARVDVGLRFRDVAGKLRQPSCTLAAGAAVQSIDVVRNVLAPLSLERRVTAVIDPNGVPRVVQRPYAPAGPIVDLDADALGIRFVVASADADVFASAASIVVSFRATADFDATKPALAEVTLDAKTPASTVAIADVATAAPLWARIRAIAPGGASDRTLSPDRQVAGRVDVASADLVPPGPVEVRISRAASLDATRYPTITVTLRAAGNPDAFFRLGASPRTCRVFPSSPFSPPSYEYKVDWIDTTVSFDPIPGAFHAASSADLVIDPATEPRG